VSSNYGPTPETTQHIDADECAANARLIAAAPDLLAACEAALRGHGRVHEDECTIGSDDNRCSCHVGMFEAAVAKAKGEKP
jgi:hypothetical protein